MYFIFIYINNIIIFFIYLDDKHVSIISIRIGGPDPPAPLPSPPQLPVTTINIENEKIETDKIEVVEHSSGTAEKICLFFY